MFLAKTQSRKIVFSQITQITQIREEEYFSQTYDADFEERRRIVFSQRRKGAKRSVSRKDAKSQNSFLADYADKKRVSRKDAKSQKEVFLADSDKGKETRDEGQACPDFSGEHRFAIKEGWDG